MLKPALSEEAHEDQAWVRYLIGVMSGDRSILITPYHALSPPLAHPGNLSNLVLVDNQRRYPPRLNFEGAAGRSIFVWFVQLVQSFSCM
ncbi:hypothetical protein [Trichocoleus sp. FACHB-262]|uniref:hypothetical protein n=1 Tax=Trichocoleus sp. FACHB-262 TaxID=2692869 RepID=UPI0016850DB6|nr:hypothetical protein [Trichocoleus sp. FACHB-262]MBD2123946.1 hypothetical protein [Trichocoleus sp. FACHB-262]